MGIITKKFNLDITISGIDALQILILMKIPNIKNFYHNEMLKKYTLHN